MPKTLRLSDHEIAAVFSEWATKQREIGVRLIAVEGISGAGKSCLLNNLCDAGFFSNADFMGIQLDDLLPKPSPDNISWVKQVEAAGAVRSICTAMKNSDCVIVEGPAAWPVVMPIAETLGQSKVSRAYLKRMSTSGNVIEWCDGEDLLDHAATSNPYFQSIYEHHGRDKPWLSADLIIERMPQE